MNVADVAIWILLVIGFVSGLARGFVRGLMSLVGLFLGIVVAAGNCRRLADPLLSSVPGDRAPEIVAFVIIFVVVALLVGVVARIISKALKLAALGWLDRLAGAALGIIMASMVAGILLLLAVMGGLEGKRAFAESEMAPRVIGLTDVAVSLLPEEARDRIEDHYARLRKEWERAKLKREEAAEERDEKEPPDSTENEPDVQ